MRSPEAQREDVGLARRLNVTLLTLYGLGVTIGAGIYVILGATAGRAGFYTPLVFVFASVLAGLSAASFAELSARYPVSAGEAEYIRRGLRLRSISLLAGLGVATSGCVSSATLLQGGTGYLREFLAAPDWLLIAVPLAIIGALVIWGISQSVTVAAILTVVEIGGLLVIVASAPDNPAGMVGTAVAQAPPLDLALAAGIASSVLLAFFAFIGFEDMVNVAEEVENPQRVMPIAIGLTLVITTLLYGAVALVAVTGVPLDELAASDAPLALVFERLTGADRKWLSLIAIAAVLNGAVIQIVMASRVVYGLARMGYLPDMLGRVWPATQTPAIATLLVIAVMLTLTMSLSLTGLAETTSSLTLAAFALVNLSLWRLKGRETAPTGVFAVPRWVPLLGFITTGGFLVIEIARRSFELFG